MMKNEEKIFLTVEEAVRAIAADFNRYETPAAHLLEMCRLLEDSGPVQREPGAAELETYLISRLEKGELPLEKLAEICGLAFWTLSHTGRSPDGKCLGIWIKTMLENYRCKQCGQCCIELDYRDECTVGDCEMWKRLGRHDILERVLLEEENGEILSARIWVKPGTQLFEAVCPWLKKEGEGRYICLIHDVKPEVCRHYPGTRKHAILTGCRGIG